MRIISASMVALVLLGSQQASAAITGTNGVDVFIPADGVNASTQSLNTSITNAYSGASVGINGTFLVITETFDGLGDTDIFLGTNGSDYYNARSSLVPPAFQSIEVFIAGDSADIVDLSTTDYSLGDLEVQGGSGDDIIWSNAGNDSLFGAAGSDIIDGGPGNDLISGNGESDILSGGEGNDQIEGGSGSDELYGGIGNDNLKGGSGNDLVFGGEGNDTILFEFGGDDTIDGGLGFDELFILAESDRVTITPNGIDLLVSGYTIEVLQPIGSNALGTIDLIRVEQVRFNDGSTVALVPEPSSLALLGIGGLILSQRRRG